MPNTPIKVTVKVVGNTPAYQIPPATNTTLGGVIIPDGGGLAIDAGGNLTVSGGGGDYVPLLDKTGTIIDYYSNTTIFGSANATDSIATGTFIYDDGVGTYQESVGSLSVNQNYEQSFTGVFKDTANGQYKPLMRMFDGNSDVTLEMKTVDPAGTGLSVGIEAKSGTSTYYTAQNANCILTRGYADTRYAPIGGGGGNYLANVSLANTPLSTYNLNQAFSNATSNMTVGLSQYIGFVGIKKPNNDMSTVQVDGGSIPKLLFYTKIGTQGTKYEAFGGNTELSGYVDSGTSAGVNISSARTKIYAKLAGGSENNIEVLGNDIVLGKNATGSVWSDGSVLTRGYADTRYLPLLANTTSNSTIPIKSTTGSNQTVSGVSFAGVGLGQPYTGVSGFAASGAYIAETYKGNDATIANQFSTLSIGFSSVNLLSRILDSGSVHGFESMGASATGTRLINRTTGNATGMINLNAGTTAFPAMSDSGKGFTALMHAGNGAELTADSMNIGICANSTHGTAELRYGANLTAVHNANSILTQGYADTRYAPIGGGSSGSYVPLNPSSNTLYQTNQGGDYEFVNLYDGLLLPGAQNTVAVTTWVQLRSNGTLLPGRYVLQIINPNGSTISVGGGIVTPAGFNSSTAIGQTAGSVTIIEFIVWDDGPTPIVYLYKTTVF